MFKIPFLSRLFEKKAPVKAKTPDEKEAPAEKKAVSAKPQPSNELQLPADHALYKLWNLRGQRRFRPGQPVLRLEERSFANEDEARKELQKLRKTLETASQRRLKQIQPQKIEDLTEDPALPDLDAMPVVHVSGDGLDAWVLILPPVGNGQDLNRAMLDRAFKERGVTFGLKWRLMENLPKEQERYFRLYHAARGTPAVNGADGQVTELFQRHLEKSFAVDEHNRVDYTTLNNVQNVEEGGVICRIALPEKGVPGKSVQGQEIPAKDGKAASIPKGRNTEVTEDGTALIATIAGHVDFTGRAFQVKPLMEIKGNVDFSVGNINYLGDVIIHGDICSGFTVRAVGSITVDGVVEACTVEAGGDLILARGVQGDSKAVIRAQRSLYAKFLENCCVYVKETLQTDCIINCDVYCDGKVDVHTGHMKIIGGTIRAAREVSAGTIGSRNEGRTDVFLGGFPCESYDFDVLTKEVNHLETELAQTERQPDNPVKKNKMNKLKMQLLVSRKKLEQLRKEQTEQSDEELESFRMVCDTVYPGTILTIGKVSHRFDRKLFPCTASLVADEIWLA
ncbi:MAG: DUF342 domain-containing protein [Oscillibacter sp.]|jgi:hypothetical protein|nr:DUF342 domain-containing protein [Oscillibacter sp.]